MSELKLTADSGGGTVSIKGPSTTGSNGNREFLLPDTYSGNGSLVTADSNGDILLADSDKLKLGTGSDLQIYHTGSQSRIENSGTGELRIQANDIQIVDKEANDFHIKCEHDGAVEIYYDNVKQFYTTATGSRAVGRVEFDGGIRLTDTREIQFGDPDGGDFKIYHDGSESWIKDTGTGDLNICASDLQIKTGDDSEFYITAVANGAVSLYYDNSAKLETTSYGVFVGGTFRADVIDMQDNKKSNWGNDDDLEIYHDGSNSFIADTGTGHLYNLASDWRVNNAANTENMIIAQADGGVELYYDHSVKAQTYNDGFKTKLIVPYADNTYNMGTSALRWVKLYAASSTIGTSDKNEKNTIVESDLGLSFINKLKPVSYKWNNTNNDTATHYGLIAQDIEEVIKSEGKTLEDFGAIEKPDNAPMGLGYSELISPLIKAVQELSAKVEALEAG